MNAEQRRLAAPEWRTWGPYLSERQWGTVREDYSPDGDVWAYFTHDDARARAYRWGEDGLAGFCDDRQILCLALALWNGVDPVLKERLFGLTGEQGNHGEDVKECYYHLDGTPTHSYHKLLYKYPQAAFPYTRLVEENRRRSRRDPEFELIDTGVFDEGRYFDVFVEYAKAGPEEILLRITAHNRGPAPATLHLIPQLWFRNGWSWNPGAPRPALREAGPGLVTAEHPDLGPWWLHAADGPELLFCDNDTNVPAAFGAPGVPGFFRDAIDACVVRGERGAVNPAREGTKVAARHARQVPPGGSVTVRLRLARTSLAVPFADFAPVLAQRAAEADDFYAQLQARVPDCDARRVQRQAYAGLLWSKQFYDYDVARWLQGDPGQPPPPPERRHGRNSDWFHLVNADVLSVPDKWEYPWYAAWDLAFQCVALAELDPEYAKAQLVLFTREWYMHPNGQLPAYEWSFGDANPPVHAWAAWRVYKIDRRRRGGRGDLAFLERVFHKLLMNFTWWANRKDVRGSNLFQGGFLGLDNIGVFNRSEMPPGVVLEQTDGTSWMAMYALDMLRIALELAPANPIYQDLATKFFEHFLYIAGAMQNIGGHGMGLWDEEDQFFYDVLMVTDASGRHEPATRVKLRSLVGLIPLFAVETLEPALLRQVPEFAGRMEWFLKHRPDLAALISHWTVPGSGDRRLLSLLRGHRMKALLRRMLDESEFLSPHGVRSLSRYHRDHPYVFASGGVTYRVDYEPAESQSGLYGGNSNWRGPVWFPVNFLIIESLQRFHHYYGDDFRVECPTGSGRLLTLGEIAQELSGRLCRLFLRDAAGRRPCFGDRTRLQADPYFRDYPLFGEYFQGDTGEGLGATHQTGWTALVAKLLLPRGDAARSVSGGEAPARSEPGTGAQRTAQEG